MCGIVGVIKKEEAINITEIIDMRDRLSVRGPDEKGLWAGDRIALGHRRLSIIDLKTGKQPMFSNDRSIVIVFNGEIYNYRDICADLRKEGFGFSTSSDTEVIIQGYKQYGIRGLLNRLEGMFAFALYDRDIETLYLARDKFGEKPFYYYERPGEFYFASEVTALTSRIKNSALDKTAINLFLSLSYIPAPYCIYENVRKLEAGHFMTIGPEVDIAVDNYYRLLDHVEIGSYSGTFEEACEELKNRLFASVKNRMLADVPIGSFLSGGIDSSIISSIMAQISSEPISTFSVGFNDRFYDESKRAQLLANNINSLHKLRILDYAEVVNDIDKIVLYHGEPFGDSSSIPTYFVAKEARNDVKVVLTGDGADELFAGYEKYLVYYYLRKYGFLPDSVFSLLYQMIKIVPHTKYTNSILRRLKKVISMRGKSHFDIHYDLMCQGFLDLERALLLRKEYFVDIRSTVEKYFYSADTCEELQRNLYSDLHLVLEGDMLTKVDRMCMMNSLEGRMPFLDSKVVEFAFSLPMEYKLQGNNQKRILKRAFGDILPKETLQYSKKGFGIPIEKWMRDDFNKELMSLLSYSSIEKQELFNYSFIERILKEHFSGKENHKGRLWNLYVFQKWYFDESRTN